MRPSIIEVKNIIGYGTPLAGTNKIHGSVMNKTELQQMRSFYHWHHDPFMIPADFIKIMKIKLLKDKSIMMSGNSYLWHIKNNILKKQIICEHLS